MSAITVHSDLKPKKIKSVTFHFFPIYLPWSDGTRCHDLHFWMLNFKPAFSLSSFTSARGFLVPLCFLPLERYYLHIWSWYFSQQSWLFWGALIFSYEISKIATSWQTNIPLLYMILYCRNMFLRPLVNMFVKYIFVLSSSFFIFIAL